MYKQVIIYAKAPKLGTVKTRLAAGVGLVEACRLYRLWSADVIRRIARDRRWQTRIAVSPDVEAASAGWGATWPIEISRQPQGTGDLGSRMARTFRNGAPGPCLIVGSDIPDLQPQHLDQAFDALGGHDAVFGPADDGGYWLIGVSPRLRPHVRLDGVRWSTEHALADTINALGARKKIALLPDRLADIDTEADLRAWRENL